MTELNSEFSFYSLFIYFSIEFMMTNSKCMMRVAGSKVCLRGELRGAVVRYIYSLLRAPHAPSAQCNEEQTYIASLHTK